MVGCSWVWLGVVGCGWVWWLVDPACQHSLAQVRLCFLARLADAQCHAVLCEIGTFFTFMHVPGRSSLRTSVMTVAEASGPWKMRCVRLTAHIKSLVGARLCQVCNQRGGRWKNLLLQLADCHIGYSTRMRSLLPDTREQLTVFLSFNYQSSGREGAERGGGSQPSSPQ